jgi:hypothetical protein
MKEYGMFAASIVSVLVFCEGKPWWYKLAVSFLVAWAYDGLTPERHNP